MGGPGPRISVEVLVERHLPSLYRYARRLTGSPNDADDLVQETFLIAAEKLEQLREPEAAFAWLVKILRGCRSRSFRRRSAERTIPLDEIAAVEPGGGGLADEIDEERLAAVLDAMPDEYRDPLLLFYFEDLKYREIAEVLDVPLGTVMSRIARAKAYLRERLASDLAGQPKKSAF